MGDIVYWDGGEYLAPKAVASAVIVQLDDRIEIDWGEGDTQIIDGTTWKSSTISENATVGSSLFSWNTFSGYTSNFCGQPNTVDGTIHRPDLFALSGINNASGTYQLAGNFSLQTDFGAGNVASGGTINVRLFHKYGCHYSETSVNGAAFQLTGRFWLYFQSTKIRISSNIEGQFSERETTNPPDISLLLSGCAIAITYEDGTTEELPLSYCPPWVRIRTDEECPEGTCSVECEDHICCYDCSGKAVLVIPK